MGMEQAYGTVKIFLAYPPPLSPPLKASSHSSLIVIFFCVWRAKALPSLSRREVEPTQATGKMQGLLCYIKAKNSRLGKEKASQSQITNAEAQLVLQEWPDTSVQMKTV
jgi:hypothetical protein